MRHILEHCFIYTDYGMSECGWVTNVYLSESKTITNYETIGKVNPGIEIKIIDSEGQSLPRDTTGQICIRGDNVRVNCYNYNYNYE